MSKYVSIFCLTVFLSLIVFYIVGSILSGGGDPAEDAILMVGTIILLLLSFLITQIYYLIDLIKKKL
jgi:hypothetical protein